MHIFEISDSQALSLLNLEENYLNDVKAKEIKPSKLSETVSAFANAAGGDLYIGIKENQSQSLNNWDGFTTREQANEIIHVLQKAHSFGNHLKFEFLANNNYQGYILHITVSKVKDIVKSSSGEVFIRSNAGKIKISTDEELAKLKLDKGIVSFENEWVDINIRLIEQSNSINKFIHNVIPHSEPRKYLLNQDIIRDEKCKVAGILLFTDEPPIYLPKRSSVKIMRYKTSSDDIGREFLDSDPLTVEADIYNLIYNSVEKTKSIIQGIKKLGEKELESIAYPEEALHEVITNAVLHRDYSIAQDVQIRIFDNRVEIESPGKLPGHVTVSNILDTQSARNPTLVRLINKFPSPPNKDVGEGLNTAFRAMEQLRLKAPIITEKDNSVLVIIKHEMLGSPEEIVLEYLSKNEEITNSIARGITGIKSENTMKNVFLRLKKRNLLEPNPDKKGSKSTWRKPKK
ncbi:putative DNA binding domain-containing protein [Vitreoscilla massiliensis]|uniref:DNA binding domain-containing protein n=1 Tax=Vitreoscilla massiliensis TaxID=1689272 RepID=A0ABY4E0Y4_9NEIS|nr:ATP-binding protein [Vitreoscilla massiliensis]UOO89454.1 putative DNA binding domain-containing protein [Vitreoscilla massiliensis]